MVYSHVGGTHSTSIYNIPINVLRWYLAQLDTKPLSCPNERRANRPLVDISCPCRILSCLTIAVKQFLGSALLWTHSQVCFLLIEQLTPRCGWVLCGVKLKQTKLLSLVSWNKTMLFLVALTSLEQPWHYSECHGRSLC